MAHRSNITQVPIDLETNVTTKTVLDPTCGKRIKQTESKHMIFRPDATIYFCSKECKDRFKI